MPTNAPKTPTEMLEFLSGHHYHDDDGCHPWAGSFSEGLRPRIVWNGRVRNARKLLLRLSGIVVPESWFVWPMCECKTCMNPEHLAIGSQIAHNKYLTSEGRMQRGTRRSLTTALSKDRSAKLGISKAPAVYSMVAQGMKTKDIAARFGVTPSCVNKAKKVWERAGITPLTVRVSSDD